MTAIQLTDAEIAVIIDSLAFQREHIQKTWGALPGGETPNIDSALTKLTGLTKPSTYSLYLSETPLGILTDNQIEVLNSAMSEDKGSWKRGTEYQLAAETLFYLSEQEVDRRKLLPEDE